MVKSLVCIATLALASCCTQDAEGQCIIDSLGRMRCGVVSTARMGDGLYLPLQRPVSGYDQHSYHASTTVKSSSHYSRGRIGGRLFSRLRSCQGCR